MLSHLHKIIAGVTEANISHGLPLNHTGRHWRKQAAA